MDTNMTLLSTTTGTTIVGLLVMIYRTVNGKRSRCNLCGYKMEMDFKVDDVPPTPPQEFAVINPIQNGATAPKITT